MPRPMIQAQNAAGVSVWRVGRAPDPWAWIDHQYAGKARWDDSAVAFRTTYAGDSLYACFVELLAYSRPDVKEDGSGLLDGIVEDPQDAEEFPTPPAGAIERNWMAAKMTGTADLDGCYVDVRLSDTISALRPGYLRLALSLGFEDFDAASLKSAHPRELTQRLAADLYALTESDGAPAVDGVRFGSRHGDELGLWAIFERPSDVPSSHHLHNASATLVDTDNPELLRAMALHGLHWADD